MHHRDRSTPLLESVQAMGDVVARAMFRALPAAAAMLLERHPDIDAVFCGSDQVARGVMDTLRDHGRHVPDDIAVIGFDNWKVLTTNARPPLTSVDMNLKQLGRTAARALFAALDGSARSGVEALGCRVVIRGSTAPLG